MNLICNNKCPICKSNSLFEICCLSDDNYSNFVNYSDEYYSGLLVQWLNTLKPVLNRCKNCNHFFYKNVPCEQMLSNMYNSLIRKPGMPAPDREPSLSMISVMRKMKNLFTKSKPCLLDYGSGYGRWSVAAHFVGFEVYSYEPNSSRVRKCNDINYTSSINEIQNINFDFIWLEQVLEHVVSPLNILKEIKSLMNPDTILSLSVPNLDKFIFKQNLWKKWPYDNKSSHIMAPYQHLHGFSSKSLSKLLKKVGLSSIHSSGLLKLSKFYFFRLHLGKILPIISSTRRYCRIIC